MPSSRRRDFTCLVNLPSIIHPARRLFVPRDSLGHAGGDAANRAKPDAFDHSGIEADRNLTLTLDRLQELIDAREGGEAAPRHVSIMGSIIARTRLISDSEPEIARKLREDLVDGVLLAPVCPFCHQAAGLLQSIIEKEGIPTVSISLPMEITQRVEPPRVVAVDRPWYPLGEPHNPDLQKRIIMAALDRLAIEAREPLVATFR